MRLFKETIVISNRPVAENLFLLRFAFPEISPIVQPGQFINIYFPGRSQLFPRPFSIAGTDGEVLEILYKKIGCLTEVMSTWEPGQRIRVLGTLGNSFTIQHERHVLIAGGVGLAPLLFLNRRLATQTGTILNYIGARRKNQLPDLSSLAGKIFLSTDDGSEGFHGNIVNYFKQNMESIPAPYSVYACGPDPMLTALWRLAREHEFDLQLSLEKVMACGLGICQGCAIKHAQPSEHPLRLICQDGPVFNAKELDLE